MSENLTIKINGKPQNDIEYDLVEVVVDTNYFLPAMFTIIVQDNLDKASGKLQYTDSDEVFKVGSPVEIEIETDEIPDASSSVKSTLINGEITSIEPVFAGSGIAQLKIRGYDLSHRLTYGKKTRTFGDANPNGSGTTDDQIFNTVVNELGGISVGTVDKSGLSNIKYQYVMQYNQSDWDFLWSRAKQLGYQLYVENKKVHFTKAAEERGTSSGSPAALTWGLNLSSFEPRLSISGQLSEVSTTGWDPDKKEAMVGKSTSISDKNLPSIGLTKKGSALAKEAISMSAIDNIVNIPLKTVDQAKAMSHARHLQAESSFIRAEGRCRQGDPRLIAGKIVEIKEVGTRFSGKYYVTEARHEWIGGQYLVSFSASGYNENTISSLMKTNDDDDINRQFGVVSAVVTNIDDPSKQGHVQLKFPWMPKYNGAELSSNWARIASPSAGNGRGMLFMPEVDDEVLVAFEHGDLSYPYIVGILWNKKDKLPEGSGEIMASDKKKIDQRIIRSRSGHLIILNDKQGEEQIVIQDKTKKNSITINSKDNSMTIKSEGDLVLEAGGKVVLNSKGDMSLTSKGKGAFSSQGELNFDSKQKAQVKGGNSQLALEMAGSTLKGMKVDITADTQAAVKGNAMVQLQGAIVKIN